MNIRASQVPKLGGGGGALLNLQVMLAPDRTNDDAFKLTVLPVSVPKVPALPVTALLASLQVADANAQPAAGLSVTVMLLPGALISCAAGLAGVAVLALSLIHI